MLLMHSQRVCNKHRSATKLLKTAHQTSFSFFYNDMLATHIRESWRMFSGLDVGADVLEIRR
ncbi:MAG: hypothetical protein ACKPKO_07725, partial [Candidatus Fonsibacter sp.]